MKQTALIVVSCALAATTAVAADFPGKPIRLIVGFSAGGSADIGARAFAKKFGETLATTVVIDNRGGAGGSVAAQLVAVARPDGYTLLWGSVGALTINQILEKNLPYNTQTAFAPAHYYIGLTYEQLGEFELAIANRA